MCKTRENPVIPRLVFAQAVVEAFRGYPQAFVKKNVAEVMNRKVLHIEQEVCMDFRPQSGRKNAPLKSGIDIGCDVAHVVLQAAGRVGQLLFDTANRIEHGRVIFAKFLRNVGKR